MSEPDWKQHLAGRLESWRDEGLARALRTVRGETVRLALADAAESSATVLSFASNDYLGLAGHAALKAAAMTALTESGAGSRASPLVAGHRAEHAELETALADFKRAEAALVFASGFQASLATIGAIAGPADTVLLDRLAHACLLDGAKLSGARVRVFKHNSVDDLRALLDAERERRCLIAIESVYSMDGDVAPLAEIVALAAERGALLLVDEAHATGVMGPRGRGVLESAGQLPEHVIALGTLSKALGSQGGFVCARKVITDCVVHAGRAYLFSTALAPACAAAAQAALQLVDREPERRAKVLGLATELRAALNAAKFEVPETERATPIVPVLVGDETRAVTASRKLLDAGILVPAIRYPTVKKGQARLRVSVSATHTAADVARLVEALGRLK